MWLSEDTTNVHSVSRNSIDSYLITFISGSREYTVAKDCIVFIKKITQHRCQVNCVGFSFNTRFTLKEISQYCPDLIYSHKQYLVNKNLIQRIYPNPQITGNYFLEVSFYDEDIPFTRRYYDEYSPFIYSKVDPKTEEERLKIYYVHKDKPSDQSLFLKDRISELWRVIKKLQRKRQKRLRKSEKLIIQTLIEDMNLTQIAYKLNLKESELTQQLSALQNKL